jgi:RNA polymerase sigma-70 factor (ECF subfamily)
VTDPSVTPEGDLEKTSSSLLVRVQAKDQEAWERFVHLYGPLVYRWCRGFGLQEADAADVGQDVFRKVAESIQGFHHDQSGDSLRGWLRSITRTRALDFLRRKAQEPNAVGGTSMQGRMGLFPADADSVDDGSVDDEGDRLLLFRRAVDFVLEPCKEETRQAFFKVVIEGRHPADVAEELGLTPNAVYVAKSRILRKIREEFAHIIDV